VLKSYFWTRKLPVYSLAFLRTKATPSHGSPDDLRFEIGGIPMGRESYEHWDTVNMMDSDDEELDELFLSGLR